ncbi:MAG: serine hydrolase domain-containing protein [Chloroflexota bacterium]
MRRRVGFLQRVDQPFRGVAPLCVCVALLAAACGAPVSSSRLTASPSAALPIPSSTTQASAVPPSLAPSPTAAPSAAAVARLGPLSTGSLSVTRTAALQAVLEHMVAAGAPDAIAAVITEDGTWSGAAGTAGPKGRKATAVDEFAVASITKTLTAALVLRLVDQGRMRLDEPLASYMGKLKVDTNGATVRQALEMRAGLADFPQPAAADHIRRDSGHVWTAEEMVAEMDPPIAAAGASYLYSSPGYDLLARAAEHVTGLSYASALRDQLLDRWHLDRVIGQGPEHATPKPWALPIDEHLVPWTPADMGAGGSISCISSATYAPGAGSVASDAPSLAAWVWHLFSGDILSTASLGLMAPQGTEFAYGLERAPYGGQSVGASGGKTGYGAQFTMFPEAHAVIVIFVNDPEFVVEPTVTALLRAATGS